MAARTDCPVCGENFKNAHQRYQHQKRTGHYVRGPKAVRVQASDYDEDKTTAAEEVDALRAVFAVLDDLDPGARGRVLTYINDRFDHYGR